MNELIARLRASKPVAMVVQANRDGSISREIAPTAWSTYELELEKLKAHPWIKAGAAKIVPLYLHPTADALEAQQKKIEELERHCQMYHVSANDLAKAESALRECMAHADKLATAVEFWDDYCQVPHGDAVAYREWRAKA